MVENCNHDPLGASDRSAVEIPRLWDSLTERLANGALGEEPQNTQIYRVMERTAELSGGSAEPDQYGRTHIVGGTYEYHERTTPDNTDHTTYKVLIEP